MIHKEQQKLSKRVWLLHIAALAGVFATLLAWTWGTWIDVMVDFGNELYIPWRMVEGDQLFRDLAMCYGPFSNYFNALIFYLFGVSLLSLVWTNVVIFALILTLLHYLLRGFTSPVTATLACLIIMVTNGFGNLFANGNFNFICPYQHGIIHGLLFALGTLAAARRWSERHSNSWLIISGLCLGLAFLTKSEIFLAAFIGVSIAISLYTWSLQRSAFQVGILFLLGTLIPIATSWVLLQSSLGYAGAWKATLGSWLYMMPTNILPQPFYVKGLGFDDPISHLHDMFFILMAMLVVLVPSTVLAFRARHLSRLNTIGLIVITLILNVWFYSDVKRLFATPHPWPFFAAITFVLTARTALHQRGNVLYAHVAAFAAFAFAMTLKMILIAHLSGYGFVLGLPVLALVTVILWSWLPARIAEAGGNTRIFRTIIGTALTCFVGAHLFQMHFAQIEKTIEVGTGKDRFLVGAHGTIVNEALDWLKTRSSTSTSQPTVAVLPEGIMLNYLVRLKNPTPYITVMPFDLQFYREENIFQAFKANPPDIILLANRDMHLHDSGFFGQGYAVQLENWIQENYHQVKLFGDPPFQPNSNFGIAILTRN